MWLTVQGVLAQAEDDEMYQVTELVEKGSLFNQPPPPPPESNGRAAIPGDR